MDRPARRCAGRGDGGQAMLGLIPMVAALVAVAVLIIPRLGDAVGRRTEQRTAADAAALAAGTAYRDALQDAWHDVVDGPPGLGHARLLALLTTDARSFAADAAEHEAVRFAGRNDADLVEYDVASTGDALTYHVRTRSKRPIYDADGRYAYAEATGEVRLTRGLCLTAGGTRFGVLIFGVCTGLGSLPTPTPTPPEPPSPSPPSGPGPSPSPSPTPSPTPTLPDGLGALVVTVRLVA